MIFIIIFIISHIMFFLIIKRFFPVISFKRLIISLIIIFFTLSLAFNAQSSIKAALNGFNLWKNIVMPSLFPFFVCTYLIVHLNIAEYIGKLFKPAMKLLFNLPGSCGIAFLMGIISGYPVGAKMAGDLYSKGLCSKTEAERMTAFCNNSGPLFIVGSVACGMLNNPEFGLILYLSHIIGSVITGIIYRFYKNNYIDHTIKKTNINKIRNVDSFSQVFTNAIINSVNLVLFIAGFIIFFAVLSDMLKTLGIVDYICYISMTIIPSINNDLLTALIYGFLEITNGLFLLSKSTIGIDTKLVFTSLIIGWAGLSVHFQVAGILFKHNFNLKPYLIGKTIQSITSAIIAILFLKLNIFHNVNTVSLISYNGVKSISFYNYQISIIFILIILTTISIPFLNKIIRNKLQ